MTVPTRTTVFLIAVVLSTPAWGRNLPASLRALEKKGFRVGAAFVIDGRPVTQHRPDELFNPASVTKLFTAAVALNSLGGERSFQTRLLAPGKGGNRETLTVVGAGDPLLSSGDLQKLARCVREGGVERIGRLAIDLGPFDSSALPPAFGQKSTEAAYRAGIGGLQVDANRVVVKVKPGRPGKPPKVSVSPQSSYANVVNRAVTARGKKRRKGLKISTAVVRDGRMDVRVTGTAHRKRSEVVTKRVRHPARHAGCVLIRALEDAGVKVDQGPALGAAPTDGDVLCSHDSPTVEAMLIPLLKDSQNQVAESLLRLVGAEGAGKPVGFQEGGRTLKTFLIDRVGLTGPSFSFTNGSGLYDANRVSVRAVVNLLRHVLVSADLAPIRNALPVSGKDGTLKARFLKTPLDGRVHAKTGTLDQAVGLAGYVDLPDGQVMVFAILVNGRKLNASTIRRSMDKALLQVYGWVAAGREEVHSQ